MGVHGAVAAGWWDVLVLDGPNARVSTALRATGLWCERACARARARVCSVCSL